MWCKDTKVIFGTRNDYYIKKQKKKKKDFIKNGRRLNDLALE
jgi:hypothetical protein